MDVTGGGGGVGLESTPTTTSSIASASAASAATAAVPEGGRPPRYQADNAVPMPTLYNDSNEAGMTTSDGRNARQPRMGTIEVLLYNMASMLAGVAVGYDVRLTNVSPIHPKLYPKR